jgi:hypothetical protein
VCVCVCVMCVRACVQHLYPSSKRQCVLLILLILPMPFAVRQRNDFACCVHDPTNARTRTIPHVGEKTESVGGDALCTAVECVLGEESAPVRGFDLDIECVCMTVVVLVQVLVWLAALLLLSLVVLVLLLYCDCSLPSLTHSRRPPLWSCQIPATIVGQRVGDRHGCLPPQLPGAEQRAVDGGLPGRWGRSVGLSVSQVVLDIRMPWVRAEKCCLAS